LVKFEQFKQIFIEYQVYDVFLSFEVIYISFYNAFKPKIYYSNKNSLIEVEDPTNKIIIKGTYKLEIRFKHPCVFDIEELRGSNLPYEEHINIIVMM